MRTACVKREVADDVAVAVLEEQLKASMSDCPPADRVMGGKGSEAEEKVEERRGGCERKPGARVACLFVSLRSSYRSDSLGGGTVKV